MHLISEKKLGSPLCLSQKKVMMKKLYDQVQNFLLLITQLKKRVITPREFY